MRPRAPLARLLPALLTLSASSCSSEAAPNIDPDLARTWAHYGGDAGGTRYSALDQINRGNVANLRPAGTYRTGEFGHETGAGAGGEAGAGEARPTGCAACHTGDAKFEATPILSDGKLFIGTPMNRISS